jgi:hypothetical protein
MGVGKLNGILASADFMTETLLAKGQKCQSGALIKAYTSPQKPINE